MDEYVFLGKRSGLDVRREARAEVAICEPFSLLKTHHQCRLENYKEKKKKNPPSISKDTFFNDERRGEASEGVGVSDLSKEKSNAPCTAVNVRSSATACAVWRRIATSLVGGERSI